MRDLQAGRVIGEREVLVPEVAGLLGHGANRVAAVGPVGVHVQVALELRAQRVPRPRCRVLRDARAASAGSSASCPRALRRSPSRSCRRCREVPSAGPRRRGTAARIRARREISRAARRNACWRWRGARPRISRSAMRSRASTGVMCRPYLPVGRARRRSEAALVYSRLRRADRVAEGARLLSE